MATNTQEHKAQQEEEANKINSLLAELGGARVSYESVASGIRDHKETFVFKPEQMEYAQLAELATKAADEQRQVVPFVKTFNYRPWDVALSVARVCEKFYGHAPFSVAGATTNIELPVAPNRTTTIQWGTFEMPELKAKIMFDQSYSGEYGAVGEVTFKAPKHKTIQEAIRGLCVAVEEDLKVNSIYKGKAITADTMPTFLDPYTTDRSQIVWSRPVDAALRGSLLNVIQHTDRAKARGQKIHRSVLFYGEPGNGKSETINIVAQTAQENGWTYVLANGDLGSALQTARLLAPAVVAIEDFERLVNDMNDDERSNLLEQLDGTTSKGKDIILLTTTNFIGDLQQSVRRRMFKEIEFGAFDVAGTDRFLRLKLKGLAAADSGSKLPEEESYGANLGREYTDEEMTTVDYPKVAYAMEGWGNSYISKVIDFASGLALEHEEPALTTADLLDAVEAQRPDWEGYLASQSRPTTNKLDKTLSDLVAKAVTDQVTGFNDNIGTLEFTSK